jgi:HSP20 family protein
MGTPAGATYIAIESSRKQRGPQEDTMKMIRFDPLRELDEITERMNRAMYRPFMRFENEEAFVEADWAPVVDIEETAREYVVKAELPDVKKDDVKVAIENGLLTIVGERTQEKEEKGRKVHRIERSYGKFARKFTVPRDVDDKKVAAEFKDGLLTVRVPKSEALRPRTIEVKVA